MPYEGLLDAGWLLRDGLSIDDGWLGIFDGLLIDDEGLVIDDDGLLIDDDGLLLDDGDLELDDGALLEGLLEKLGPPDKTDGMITENIKRIV